jgi:hypothetical protein
VTRHHAARSGLSAVVPGRQHECRLDVLDGVVVLRIPRKTLKQRPLSPDDFHAYNKGARWR